MAYTLDKDRVRVKDAIWWIAEHAYPEEFQENSHPPVKRVRQRIQDAFELHKHLPGSEHIKPARTGALPNDAILKAPEFFIWAIERWPVLREQEGIIPLLGTVGNVAFTLPMPTLDAFSVETPQDLAELQKQHIAAETKAYRLQRENDALRVDNDSLKKKVKEFEEHKREISEVRAKARTGKTWPTSTSKKRPSPRPRR